MAFNPIDYLIKLKGKEYLEVKYRLVWFREDNPPCGEDSISLVSEIVNDTGEEAVVKAYAYAANGRILATSFKRESKKEFHDYLEKAETGAYGRVLAILGYGTQFAEELDLPEGKLVDAPASPRKSAASKQNEPTEREKAIQAAKEKAEAKQQASQVEAEPDKPEPPAAESYLNNGQKKAIQNVTALIEKKNSDFNREAFFGEYLAKFGKEDIDHITEDQAKELISALNAEFKLRR